jgi:hypothetical protein
MVTHKTVTIGRDEICVTRKAGKKAFVIYEYSLQSNRDIDR